jgi:tetratricopeptide (TPR) repeat protein
MRRPSRRRTSDRLPDMSEHPPSPPASDSSNSGNGDQTGPSKKLKQVVRTVAVQLSPKGLKDSLLLTAVGALAVTVLEPLMEYHVDRYTMGNLRSNLTETASTIYFRDGNTQVARELVDQAIEIDQEHADARYLRAYLDGMDSVYRLLNLERTLTDDEQDAAHRALAGAEFLINSDGGDPRGYLLRGQSFMALERYEEAFRALARARDLAADQGAMAIQALALWRLGTTRLERASGGSDGLAEDRLEMADDPFAQAMSELSRSVVLFKLADSGSREAEAGKWPRLWRGIALRNEKWELDGAIREFELALDEDPNFALAEFNKGEAYWAKWISADRTQVPPKTIAQWQQTAIDSFERARKLDPGLARPYFGLGLMFGSDIKYAVAKRYFDKALELNPLFLRAREFRARTLHNMGAFEQAIEDFDAAIALEPSEASLFVYRARSEIELGNLVQARTDLQQARALGNGDRFLPLTEAELSLALGMPERALKQVEAARAKARATGTDRDFAEAFEVAARAHYALARRDAALDAMNAAVARSTYRPERFLLARGCLLYDFGLTANALTDFSMALLQEPEYGPAAYGELVALRSLGVSPEAPRLEGGADDRAQFWQLKDPYARLCGFAGTDNG